MRLVSCLAFGNYANCQDVSAKICREDDFDAAQLVLIKSSAVAGSVFSFFVSGWSDFFYFVCDSVKLIK